MINRTFVSRLPIMKRCIVALYDAVALLYDSALIAEGSPVADPARFNALLAKLMLG